MKILIFSWRDIENPKAGGAELHTYELAKRWVKMGHPVTLVSSRWPGGSSNQMEDGVRIFRPAELYDISPYAYLKYIWQTAHYYRRNLAGRFDVVIDQIHAMPIFARFFVKEKLIAFPHEVARQIWFYEAPFPASLLGYLCEPLAYKLYTNTPFITVSPSTKKDLNRFGIANVSLIPEGISLVPLKKIPRKTSCPQFISLGRLTRMKRIEETIHAFSLVSQTYSEARLIIAGRRQPANGYEEELHRLVRRLKIEEKVIFAGAVSEKEKTRLLKASWALLCTSVREGWGITVIEAAACGTPTIAYRVAGLADSVRHEETGLLTEQNTPLNLANLVGRFIVDYPLRSNLSLRALEYSRHFTWDKAAAESLAVLKNILSSF